MTVPAQIPADEPDRLAALRRYAVLDTAQEERFDRVTRLAARMLGCPITLVSLIDVDRQWFKSRIGLDPQQTHRDLAFCAHAILGDDVFQVPDATRDPRFAANPLVTGYPDIRFYAGAPLVTPGGQAIGTLCVIDRQPRPPLTEAEQQTLRDLAAIVVDELELRIAHTLVEAERDIAKAGERSKALFLATMSHEIRTPMNGILGAADLILGDTAIPAETRHWAEIIRDSGAALKELLDNVLDLAKLESGRVELESVAFAPAELVAGVAATVEPLAARKGLRLETGVTGAAAVLGDPCRVRQVLLNLMSNAVKFTERGRVRVAADADPGGLSLEVEDTGIGMTEAERLRLFSPFSQADASITRRFGGSGLGLSIVRYLVDAMGGTLAIDSEPGRGTRIRLSLPLPCTTAADPVPLEAPPQLGGRPARILLVEDNSANREIASAQLLRLGQQVVSAADGDAALRRLQEDGPFDLVLLDIHMPGMDGFTCLRQLRQQGFTRPVIAMTADALPDAARTYVEAGFDAYLGKPFRPAQLHAIVARAWLDQEPPRAPGAPVEGEEPRAAVPPLLDDAVLQELLSALGPAPMVDLARMGLETGGRLVEAVRTASLLGQGDPLRLAAHELVSMTGSLGLSAVSAAARSLEQTVRQGGMPDPAHVARFAALWADSAQRLHARMQEWTAAAR